VTVCTKGKGCYFGRVVHAQVELSVAGQIVAEEWKRTPHVRSGIELDEWQVMPNHFHGIIHILEGPADVETPRRGVSKQETFHRNGLTNAVNPPRGDVSEQETARRAVSTSSLKPNSLGAIMGQFKAACTRRIWAAGFHDFAWQPRFFDRVIRNQDELEKVREYIRLNPLMWDKEAGNIENLFL